MQVHFDTFREEPEMVWTDKKGVERRWKLHSVEITIKNDRRRVSCSDPFNGRMVIHGLGVRFSNGEKVWPGTAYYWLESGNVNSLTPNIDKRGYFYLAGFFEDFDGKKVASQHNAVAA